MGQTHTLVGSNTNNGLNTSPLYLNTNNVATNVNVNISDVDLSIKTKTQTSLSPSLDEIHYYTPLYVSKVS